MKRLTLGSSLALSLLAAVAFSSRAIYAGEQPVATDENRRVTLETESVQRAGQYVQANFWAYTGNDRFPIAALVDGCDKGSGKISYKVNPQDPGALANVDLWKSEGEQVTDKMAAAACLHAKRG